MNILNNLTKKNLLLNKKRTVVTIIGIILAVALIMALSTLVVSFRYSLMEYQKVREGNYHVSFSDINRSDLSRLKDNRYVDKAYFTKDIGYAKIDGIVNSSKPYVFLQAFDYEALDNLGLSLTEGRTPVTSDELVVSSHLKTNGRVDLKVGDTITLDIGDRKGIDDVILNQENPYQEGEIFKKRETKTYKIVGKIERLSYKIEGYSSPGYTLITCLDSFTDEEKYTAYLRYHKKYLRDYLVPTANILGIDVNLLREYNSGTYLEKGAEYSDTFYQKFEKELEKASFTLDNINNYLISLEYVNLNDSELRSLYTIAGIITIIIIVTSVYCIKNSFNISITEKTKQYGMLASIGATKRQIRKNVLYEAFILGLIGIPIGLASGIFAAFVLIQIAGNLLKESLNINLSFSVSFGAFLLSVVLSIITIYFSSIKSARKASRITPMAAIRNSDDIKVKSKKLKTPVIIKKIFGIGGVVSYKNLKRNNKKYRTTVISIVVCVSVFIALSSFMDMAFKTVKLQFGEVNHNIAVILNDDDEVKKEEAVKSILNIDGIDNYSIINSIDFTFKAQFTEQYKKHFLAEDEQTLEADVKIVSLGEREYKKYLSELGLNYDNVKDKGIVINNLLCYQYNEETNKSSKIELSVFDYEKNDVISGKYHKNGESNDKGHDFRIKIAALTDKRPLGLEDLSNFEYYIVVSDEFFHKNLEANTRLYFYANVSNPDYFQDETEKIVKSLEGYHITNLKKEERQQRSLFTLVGLFLYGFITVIALIGITNIFNTLTTNMELRSREFATLKSVGMTKREFNHMISLESVFYGTKSLLIGIPIGILLSLLLYKALVDGDIGFSYTLPIKAIIISVLAVLILISVIMHFSINKIAKQNTIETIRNDNI